MIIFEDRFVQIITSRLVRITSRLVQENWKEFVFRNGGLSQTTNKDRSVPRIWKTKLQNDWSKHRATTTTSAFNIWELRAALDAPSLMASSAVNERGREKKGPLDIAPKSFSPKGPKWCSVLSIGVIRKSALEIGYFPRRNFWMISGGPIPLPAPFVYCWL